MQHFTSNTVFCFLSLFVVLNITVEKNKLNKKFLFLRQVPKGISEGWLTTETKKQTWLRRRIIFCLETIQEKVTSFPVSRIYASYTDKQYIIELFTRKHVILLNLTRELWFVWYFNFKHAMENWRVSRPWPLFPRFI